ncbi:hypothetical protein E2C01_064080 [Portunus trituberculatus]|uniref:Uncharacterized protein n=1 Tax=Portunus trituberculatus TaxID=210409 RepID=A0A5B7HJD6_PORTR|nr:hypothetical protein [Portunus trituberculatus]
MAKLGNNGPKVGDSSAVSLMTLMIPRLSMFPLFSKSRRSFISIFFPQALADIHKTSTCSLDS